VSCQEIDSVLKATSIEIEALRRESRVLHQDLTDLQQTSSRLAKMLTSQRVAIRNLLERITPASSQERLNQAA
jgi:seryl-tRNA synthetase